jgi:hypothetical protein
MLQMKNEKILSMKVDKASLCSFKNLDVKTNGMY